MAEMLVSLPRSRVKSGFCPFPSYPSLHKARSAEEAIGKGGGSHFLVAVVGSSVEGHRSALRLGDDTRGEVALQIQVAIVGRCVAALVERLHTETYGSFAKAFHLCLHTLLVLNALGARYLQFGILQWQPTDSAPAGARRYRRGLPPLLYRRVGRRCASGRRRAFRPCG